MAKRQTHSASRTFETNNSAMKRCPSLDNIQSVSASTMSSSFQMLRHSFSALRRSNPDNTTIDVTGTSPLEKPSRYFPLTKPNGLLSKAWREHRKKKNGPVPVEEGSVVDEEIVIKRDLTRRRRNSFLNNDRTIKVCHTALLPGYYSSEHVVSPTVHESFNHSLRIASALSKSHMLDIDVVGYDNIPVSAARFVLGCVSAVLEELFFKRVESSFYNEKEQTFVVDFCNSQVLRAAIYYCFSGELPVNFDVDSASEDVARNLAELYHFAYKFQIRSLEEVTYRATRTLINRRPMLACAVFDELASLQGTGTVDSIKCYALDTMREMPMDTLLSGGVQWMKEESVDQIMRDEDIDVDEFFMFKILKAWEQGALRTSDRLSKARNMAKHITLKFIEIDHIQTEVAASGYFEEGDIIEAIRVIKDTWANRDPHEIERVIVEGAGTPKVNGIYLRVKEDMGLSEEEILFIKEAEDGFSDVGLYLYGGKWRIAMCADYSNCFYFCPDNPINRTTVVVPQNGWTSLDSGMDPPPTCIYLPNTRAARLNSDGSIIVPNLEEMIDPTIAEKRRSFYVDKAFGDYMKRRTITLEQMMNLPEDRDEWGKYNE